MSQIQFRMTIFVVVAKLKETCNDSIYYNLRLAHDGFNISNEMYREMRINIHICTYIYLLVLV